MAEAIFKQENSPTDAIKSNRGWNAPRLIIAAILLFAAGMKAWQLATAPTLGEGLLHARWFNILVVEFEIAFAVWLFSGLLQEWTRIVAIGLFTIFAGISLYKALSGETSCGCFGAMQLSPWYTTLLDVAVISMLLFYHSKQQSAEIKTKLNFCQWKQKILMVTAWLLTSVSILYVVEKSNASNGLAVIGTSSYHFGINGQLQELKHTFELINNEATAIRIVKVQSSCGCTWIEKNSLEVGQIIQAKEKVHIDAVLKTGLNDAFTKGHLAIFYDNLSREHSTFFDKYILLQLSTKIASDYQCSRKIIDFGDVNGAISPKVTESIKIAPVALSDLKILSTRVSDSRLQITQEHQIIEKGHYLFTIKLDLTNELVSGKYNGYVGLQTNSKVVPEIVIPVTATYQSPIEINPTGIAISSSDQDQILKNIDIQTSLPSMIKSVIIEGAEEITPLITVEAETAKTLHTIEITVPQPLSKDLSCNVIVQLAFVTSTIQPFQICECKIPVYRFYQEMKNEKVCNF